jgi:endonuclease YncB( thermonuclease family)
MEHERRGKLFSSVVLAVLLGLAFLALNTLSDSSWLKNSKNKLSQTQPGLYPIAKFIDGDTVTVDMNGTVETIRMIGVDTPETHRPNTPVQCYGPEAADFTKMLIGSQKVRLKADPLDTNRDRYGRLLRYVYLPDGRMVETELISKGYGFAYTSFPFEKSAEFTKLENQAKAGKTGLWEACQVKVEDNGREQTNAR